MAQATAKTGPAVGGKAQLSAQEKKTANAQKKIDRFKKLGAARVTRAIKAIDAVAALGNRRSYTYDDAQVGKIKAALSAAADRLNKSFDANAKADSGFTL